MLSAHTHCWFTMHIVFGQKNLDSRHRTNCLSQRGRLRGIRGVDRTPKILPDKGENFRFSLFLKSLVMSDPPKRKFQTYSLVLSIYKYKFFSSLDNQTRRALQRRSQKDLVIIYLVLDKTIGALL